MGNLGFEVLRARLLPHLHALAGFALCHIQRLRELRELVVDLHLLQPAPVRRQPLLQGNAVALGVLPVGDARRDLPILRRGVTFKGLGIAIKKPQAQTELFKMAQRTQC